MFSPLQNTFEANADLNYEVLSLEREQENELEDTQNLEERQEDGQEQ